MEIVLCRIQDATWILDVRLVLRSLLSFLLPPTPSSGVPFISAYIGKAFQDQEQRKFDSEVRPVYHDTIFRVKLR